MAEWIGVDFDGTLAKKKDWDGFNDTGVGEPIGPMVERVKRWLAEGKEVRIVTARVARGWDPQAKHWMLINTFSQEQFGRHLPITAEKDPEMIELWDDRAIQLVPDTGIPWMSRAYSIHIVALNSYPLHAFTVKHECASYLEKEWPQCPTNLRVLRLRDGGSWKDKVGVRDVTATFYGLKEPRA